MGDFNCYQEESLLVPFYNTGIWSFTKVWDKLIIYKL